MPFLPHNHPLWKQLLKHIPHDVYHLPEYVVLESSLVGGEALAWYHSDQDTEYLIPLIRRRIKQSSQHSDLVSPYGYPGIISNSHIEQKQAFSLLCKFHEEATQQGFVSSFIRMNPVINPWTFPSNPTFRQWTHGGTISLQLELPMSQISQTFSVNHQRNIRRLHRQGYQAAVNQWNYLDDFIEMYYRTMERKGAKPYYFFPKSYFDTLRQILGDRIVFISVHDPHKICVSAGLFTLFGSVMQYHLGATADHAISYSPSKLMMDEAIRFGKLSGASMLHLGGGLGGSTSDGLFRFKKGFGNMFHPYSSLRFIHQPKTYNELHKKQVTTNIPKDFFPIYRYQT